MPKVQLPNGTNLDFPDGMSQEEMASAIDANFPEYAAQKEGGLMGMLHSAGDTISNAIKSVPIIAPDGTGGGVMETTPAPAAELPPVAGMAPSKWAEIQRAEQTDPMDPRMLAIKPGDIVARGENEAARRHHAGDAMFSRILENAGVDNARDAHEAQLAAERYTAANLAGNTLDNVRNVGAGFLKIGPTAAKGIADIGRLATGDRIGKDTSAYFEAGMKEIDQLIASPQFNENQAGFQQLMSDKNAGVGDLFAYLVDNPQILLDNGITTVGSMALPAGTAKVAVMGSKAAGLGAKAAGAVATTTAIGTVAAQNAADTFTSNSIENLPLADRYKAAAVSAAISILTGMATHGGAEGEIARRMAGELQTGRTTLEAVKGFLKAVGNEGAQEMGEEFGNAAGEAVGSLTPMDPTNTKKRMAFAGAVGGIFGGLTHVSEAGHQEHDPMAAGADAAEAARQAALLRWRTSGLSPNSNPGAPAGPAGRSEPSWSDVAGAPADPREPSFGPAGNPVPQARREPTIGDITGAGSVDEAIAAAQAASSKPFKSPFATAADIDALELGAAAPAAGPTFTTAKGSSYTVNPDGTTTRNKAARAEHPGDAGMQEPSQSTFYVDQDGLNALGEFQTQGGAGKRLAQHPNGMWGVQYTDGPQAGQFERRSMAEVSTQPGIGMHPVELWNDGKTVHFGNQITAVAGQNANPLPGVKSAPTMAQDGIDLTAGQLDPDAPPAPNVWRRAVDQTATPQRDAIDRIIDHSADWHAFPADTGTLGVPRETMPQIKAEHRGAMVNFLNARGVTHEQIEVPAETFKPTQAEFSLDKVLKASEFAGGNRSILVSSDNYVLDGHHQWLAAIDAGQPVKAIRLNAPIADLLQTVKEFPSATVAEGAPASTVPNHLEAADQKYARQEEAIRQANENAAKRKSTGGSRARDRVHTENPFLGFLATHGVNINERADAGAERGRAGNPLVPGFGPVFRKSGLRFDELAQAAHAAGFLTQSDIESDTDNGGTRKLADMIQRATQGKEVIRPVGALDEGRPGAHDSLLEEAHNLGIDATGMTPEQVYDAVVASHNALEQHRDVTGAATVDEQADIEHYADQFTPQEAAAILDADIPLSGLTADSNLTDEQIDEIFGIQPGTRASGQEAETGTASAAREGGQGTAQPDLLAGYTAEEVVARQDADATRAKAITDERAKLDAAERRARDQKDVAGRMDASADNFQLGQSAEEALSGQQDIFAASPSVTEFASNPNAGQSKLPPHRRQPRVHAYDPENARPLLLIACSDGKLEGAHRAGDLYQGVMFDVLRKWAPENNPPAVYVISAKHGLVHASDVIDSYDQPMTDERKQALLDKGIDVRDFVGQDFSSVFIAGSAQYRELGQNYAERLRDAGFLAPDGQVDHVQGGIGEQRGQLGEYLRELEQNAPAGAKALAQQLEDLRDRQKAGNEQARQISEQNSAENTAKRAERDAKKAAGMHENATAPEHISQGEGVDDRELADIVDEFNEAQAEMMSGEHAVSNVFQHPKKSEIVRLEQKARATGKLWDAKEVKAYNKQLDERDALKKENKPVPAALTKAIADFEKAYFPHAAKLQAEADTVIDGWKNHAQQQGEDRASRDINSRKIVLSLFDLSGEWSKPWAEAGYQVYQFDIQDDATYEHEDEETGEIETRKVGDINNMSVKFFSDMFGDFEGLDIHAILAATPCTDFAVSGARHFAAKDADGRTVSSVHLVHQTLRVIEYFKPAIWALENPVGRIERLGGLPNWRLSFDPNHLGDDYTKKTLIWGRFNGDLPVAPVEPLQGSKMHTLYGGKSMATKNARSETPPGFSYGFFMANNAIDHPVMAIANKYDRLDRSLIEQAVNAGATEEEISNVVDDPYYMDLDDEAANEALQELIAEKQDEPTPVQKEIAKARGKTAAPAPAAPAATVKSDPTTTPSLDGMFDELLAEETAAKPVGDLGDLFDGVLAEELERAKPADDNAAARTPEAARAALSDAFDWFLTQHPDAKEPGAMIHNRNTFQFDTDGATRIKAGNVEVNGQKDLTIKYKPLWDAARARANPDAAVTPVAAEKAKIEAKRKSDKTPAEQRAAMMSRALGAMLKQDGAKATSELEALNDSLTKAGEYTHTGLVSAAAADPLNPVNFQSMKTLARVLDRAADGKTDGPDDEPPKPKKLSKQKAAEKKVKDVLGAKVGDTIAFDFSGNVGYLTSGKPMIVDSISPSGEVRFKDADRESFTSEKLSMLEAFARSPATKLTWDVTPVNLRTAGAAARSAVKNSAVGMAAAVAGLGELFGANIDTKSNVVPEFDESKYRKAAPMFQAAIDSFGAAATDIREVMRAVIKAVIEQFGGKVAANMKPYVVRFVQDYQDKLEGEKNATGTSADSERDSGDRTDGEPGTEPALFEDTRSNRGGTRQARTADDRAGPRSGDGTGVHGRDAADGGAARDQRLPGVDREGGSAAGTSESGNAGRSGDRGHAESQSQSDAIGEPATALGARLSLDGKRLDQRAAERVPVVVGDRANIGDTLPMLLEGQQDDVHFAETRFADASKQPGVMFTNGTGTGKTYSGLGIAKRFERQGKGNGIILVPNNQIAADWIESGRNLGLNIKPLDTASEHGGKGMIVTTYANFGDNPTLADRKWDFVMPDEAHYLMASKDGKQTKALSTLRAITHHPDGFYQYARMKNRALYAQLDALKPKDPKAKATAVNDLKAKALYDKIRAADDALLPAYQAIASNPLARPKTVFLSATPFAYVKSVDYAHGYLFEYQARDSSAYNSGDGREAFFMQHFGYRMRYNKLTTPDGAVDEGLMARQFNTYLKQQGALSGRLLDVEADYQRRFHMVHSALGTKIDEGMEFIREHAEYKHLYEPMMKSFDYLSRRFLLEAIKAKEGLPMIREHLALGRKVVIVHDYKKGGAFNPFHLAGINGKVGAWDGDTHKEIDLGDLVDKFRAERADLVKLQFPTQSALQILTDAFPDALVHNGDVPAKQLELNKKQFNADTDEHRVMFLQSDKGREGISLHDTTGRYQRVEVNIGMPSKPTALIQLEGRIYRTGQVTDAILDYLNTGTMWERWTFAQTIAERADTAEALAMGDLARGLKDSIIEAFEASDQHPITAEDGKGGKARDRQNATLLTEWDRAKSFYFGQQKKTSRNKAAEGKDYFATPEPVGLKMVEWADLRAGEDVLEPSGGHGAIARWFPILSNKTVVEPSTELITRARLVVEGDAKFVQSNFEDLHLVNKYDAIVMNPPFGLGGSVAMPHLAKAYAHLRDGGRIVAIIPRGPAADAKFEKFLYGDKAPKDLYLVSDINLPGSTFGRAGTGVMTRIVILDKVGDPSKAPTHSSTRDYTNEEDVGALFDRLEHSQVPGRVKTVAPLEVALEQWKPEPKAAKPVRAAAPEATGAERFYAQFEFKHTKTGEDLFGASMLNRVSMDTYKAALALAKENGGWYNKFAGGGAQRGFLFKSADERTAFMEAAGHLDEVGDGLDAQNSLSGDLGVDSQLLDHMDSIKDSRGMVQADQLLNWVQAQSAPGAAPLANWLSAMGSATVALSSVVKFMESSGSAMFSKMPTFYSALARTIPDMAKIAGKDGTIKPEQARLWLAARQKEGKFKADELLWSGVDDWLKSQSGRVAVADIASFVSENGVQVEEVQKGSAWAVFDPMEREEHYFDTEGEARAYASENDIPSVEVFPKDGFSGGTKYSQYVLPGGENYRELLLTLPNKQAGFVAPEALTELPAGYEVTIDRSQPTDRQYSVIPPGQTHGKPYGGLRERSEEVVRATALYTLNWERNQKAREKYDAEAQDLGYKSSHWDEKNIVAHVRFNDRVDAEGKRVLFIEELQSDWAQQGLKNGFAGPKATPEEQQAAAAKIKDADDNLDAEKSLYEKYRGDVAYWNDKLVVLDYDDRTPLADKVSARAELAKASRKKNEQLAVVQQASDAFIAAQQEQRQLHSKGHGLAVAPFVTDTKAWLSLGIKRMIRYAAENGYDKVAFVNGEQSADRYDLSQQVERINYRDQGAGRFDIAAIGKKDRQAILNEKGVTIQRVEELVGKDVAKKIEAGEGQKSNDGADSWVSLSGVDLKVGGEGMKSFYDKIVPQVANDVLKKIGGGKVSTMDMSLPGTTSADRSYYVGPEHSLDELKAALVIAHKGGGNIMVNPLTGKTDAFAFNRVNNARSLSRLVMLMENGAPFAQAVLDDDLVSHGFGDLMGGEFKPLAVKKTRTTQQASFDITPELRASALDGLPMFSKGFDPARRQLLAVAAAAAMSTATGAKAGDLKVGKAAPIDPTVLAQRVTPALEKILRDGQEGGTTSLNGTAVLRKAMKAMSLTGPKEVRALAALVEKLLPTSGTIGLTVDDKRRMNVHGVVELTPFVHLSLFTAEGRTGLTYETVLHEALHVAVAARYRSLSVGMVRGNDAIMGLSAPQAAAAMKQFEAVWEEFRTATGAEKFGNKQLELAVAEARGNPDEFFVRTMTDPVLQAYMAGKQYEGKTLWARFKDWVKTSLFGFSKSGTAPSWLDAALAASGDVAAAMGADKADFSRMAAISRVQAQRENSTVAGADTMESRALPDPAWSDPDMNRIDNIIHTLQDKQIDMKRVVQAIRTEMGALEDKWDPYLQEELFHGRAATGFKDYLHNELRPLLSDMQARGVTMEEFEEFLHMRHAQEANEQIARVNPEMPDGGSGIDTADAQDYLANQAPAKLRAFEALAARIDATTAETQRLLVDYGLEKQDTIDTWNATYENYVPLMREDMDAGKMGNGTGQGYSVRGSASKRRMGSDRAVVNIVANIAMARERAVVRGEKNRVDMALYGLALKAPNPEFWKPINPLKNPDALAAELANMGLSPAHAAAIVAEPRQRVIDKQTGLVTRRANPLLRSAPNVVAVRVNGEDRFLFFNEKNDRAMRMAVTLKNMGNDQVGWFLGAAGKVTRAFAAINTQYNPVFGVVNLVRDTGEGAINLTATPIAGKQHEVIGEAGRLLGAVVAKNFQLDSMTGADAALWHEFQQEGGITGFRAQFGNSDDRAKELAKELKKMSAGGVSKAGHAVFDWLSDYNEALENVTRMAAYKVAKDHGLTNQQAASLAKNLTVNFNRRGAIGAQVGSLYAFFNAAVQGTARMAQTLNGPAGAKIIAGGLLLGALQAIMMAAAGYDDEDPPEFVKARNVIIPLGWISGKKNYVSVPMPLGFSFIPTIGRVGTEFFVRGRKNPGKQVGKMIDALLDAFNPLGSSTLLQTLAPTAVDPIAALAENRDWTGKPIARKDLNSLKPTPGYTRTKDTASAVAKTMAYYFNAASGGSKYTPGFFSPTPDQIDYLLGTFTGGVGREALKAQQTASALYTGEEVPAYKVPLSGRFYGNAEDKSSISAKFYDNLLDVNVQGEEVTGRAKDHGDARGYLVAHPEARLADLAGSVQRELQQLGKHKRELLERGADRARIKELELKMRSTMERFNNKVEEAKKKAPA